MNEKVIKFDNLKNFINKFNLSPRIHDDAQKILEKTELENVAKLSTSALLLENRPPNLPPKSPEDILKHQKEFEEMTKISRERFKKEAIKSVESLNKEKYREEIMSITACYWRDQVMPNWELMKNNDSVKKEWWKGLPSSIRGHIWFLCYGKKFVTIDSDYLVSLAKCSGEGRFMELFENFFSELSTLPQCSPNHNLNPAKSNGSNNSDENQNHSSDGNKDVLYSIDLDVERTFPNLKLFQNGAPFYNHFRVLLAAFALCRPQIGYVQGLSFIAAILLLNMEWLPAVQTMIGIISSPLMTSLYTFNQSKLEFYFNSFEKILEESIPIVHQHFKAENLTPNIYLIEWLFTMYSKTLPLDIASRIWDLFCRDGEEFLFLVAFGLLNIFQMNLLCMNFFTLAQFLNHLPSSLTSEQLFNSIESLPINASNIGKQFKKMNSSFIFF